jgi:predicted RNA-binding Zn ribbon-like protein
VTATASARLIGGHPVLDLVNTVAWRLDPARTDDRLTGGPALVGLLESGHVIDTPQALELGRQADARPQAAAGAVEQVRQLREALYGLLQPVAVGAPPVNDAVLAVRAALAQAIGEAEISADGSLRWVAPVRTLADLPHVVALSALRLMELEDLDRLRQCHDEHCGWLFLDRSKNASRRWCSSADCGNRTRARRHSERRRGAGAPALAAPGRRSGQTSGRGGRAGAAP